MAKYTLKRNLINKDEVNRLLKTVINNAKEDRLEAFQLFEKCKTELDNPLNTAPEVNEETGVVFVDGFPKLIGAATSTLNQMQAANEKLLKILVQIHKFLEKPLDSKNPNSGISKDLNDLFNSIDLDKKPNNGED